MSGKQIRAYVLLASITGLLIFSFCGHPSRYVKRTKNRTISISVKGDEKNISNTPALHTLAAMTAKALEKKIINETKCKVVQDSSAELELSIQLNYTLSPCTYPSNTCSFVISSAYQYSFKDLKKKGHDEEGNSKIGEYPCVLNNVESVMFPMIADMICNHVFNNTLYNNYYN